MSFLSIEFCIANKIKEQALCENKLFRNIVPHFPPFTVTVTHLSLLPSSIDLKARMCQ